MTEILEPVTATLAEIDKWEREWDHGPEWATYPGRRLIVTIRAREAELTAAKGGDDA